MRLDTFCIVCAASLPAASVHAQVQFIDIHPAGSLSSGAYTGSGALQGGYTHEPATGNSLPVLWNYSPAYTNLLPAGFVSGQVSAMDSKRQVGGVWSGSSFFAALWAGSAQSFTNLHPAGYFGSEATCIAGALQGGSVRETGTLLQRAALWSGSAATFTSLHPVGRNNSAIYAMSGQQQGGWASLGGAEHAALWTGSATSFTSLHPAAFSSSVVRGIGLGPSGPVQVGIVDHQGTSFISRAALWRGTAGSFIDMNPANANWSAINATTGTVHAGYIGLGFTTHAGIWLGDSSSSFLDLHAFLAPGYDTSVAHSVWNDGGNLIVSGSARFNGSYHAVLWVVPAPGAASALALGLLAARRPRNRGS